MSQFDQDLRTAVSMLESLGLFKKNVVLFGAGKNSKKLYEEITYRNYKIKAVIDNNSEIEGNLFESYKIEYAPDFIKEEHINTVYLILSAFYPEIKRQMEEAGLREGVDFYKVFNINTNRSDLTYEKFCNSIDKLLKGKKVYIELLNRYGEDVEFFINPANSLGDIYLMSLYIDGYIEKVKNAIFVLGSERLVELANKLGIKRCIYISIIDIEYLLVFAQVFQFEKNHLKLLHTGFIHFRIWSRMLTYLGITWMEHYRELFELSAEYQPKNKILQGNENEVQQIFSKNNLKEGRTILLAPYANTIREISLNYWYELAQSLIDEGFCVCTNVGGKSEIPIKNTIPLCIDINNFSLFVEKAGYFIGIRNGLSDLLLKCKANIAILYSDEMFDLISVYNFYSLKRMGRTSSLIEKVIPETDQRLLYLKDSIMDLL